MPLDGITAKAVTYELNKTIVSAKIEKISQPSAYDVLLHFYNQGKHWHLLLSANPSNPRMHLTTTKFLNPKSAPNFCMLLRKYLSNARLIEIKMQDYERNFHFKFETTNELGDTLQKTLVFELMGKHSNLVLLNEKNIIHDAIRHIDQSVSRFREVMPARPYLAPPKQNKWPAAEILTYLTPLSSNDFFQTNLWQETLDLPLEKALLHCCQGFSPQLIIALIHQMNLEPNTLVKNLNPEEKNNLKQVLQQICEAITTRAFQPCLYYAHEDMKYPVDFHALNLVSIPYKKILTSISAAIDNFYQIRETYQLFNQEKDRMQKKIQHQIQHLNKKKKFHLKDIHEGEKADKYKKYGDLLLCQLHAVKAREKSIALPDLFDAAQPLLTIPLNPSFSPSKNAQGYFRLYDKAKRKLSLGQGFLKKDLAELDWLLSLEQAVSDAENLDDIIASKVEFAQFYPDPEKRKQSQANLPNNNFFQPGKPGKKNKFNPQLKKKTAKKVHAAQVKPPRHYLTPDGFEIFVGRNNLQNDHLTTKTAKKSDTWLHVQQAPGTHVIIRHQDKPLSDASLLAAAQIAAWFSKSNKSGFGGKMPVDYCEVRYVKKIPGAKPGMVTYSNFKTLIVEPLNPSEITEIYSEQQP